MAIATRAHRSTWQLVSRFLAVSDFVGDHLVAAGIPAGKIVVHPNTAQSHGHAHPPGRDFVFLGRLTAEKGIRLLISAWAQSDLSSHHRLVVAGDGPEREVVVRAKGLNVQYEGLVGPERVTALLNESGIVVIPSLCYEGFPRLIAEAFERGRPIASTALGALQALITDRVGWTAEPTPGAFATMLASAIRDPTLGAKAAAARSTYVSDFSPDANIRRALSVYEQVVQADSRTSSFPAPEKHVP